MSGTMLILSGSRVQPENGVMGRGKNKKDF
jgi:hypothetical protein